MTSFLIFPATVGFASERRGEGFVRSNLEEVTEFWECSWSGFNVLKESKRISWLLFSKSRVQRDGGWAVHVQKKGWRPPGMFFWGKQCCFQDTYGARTCTLKPNGTQAFQHLPAHAPNCMWQDSRWCANVKRICLDLFLQSIPQAAFKLRKA